MSYNNRKLFGSILAAVTAAGVMLSSFTFTAFAAGDDVNTVTIFTTNDIHGVVSGESFGLDTVAAVKESTPNALLVDAGDATQGASFATVTKGEDVIRVMNAVGYDLMIPGNHEFDYGIKQFRINREKIAAFPIISSNVMLYGEPMLGGYTIAQSGAYTIGFVGVTTAAVNTAMLDGVEFIDEIKAVEDSIALLEDNISLLGARDVDAIVIVGHLGDNAARVPCTSEQLLDGLSAGTLSRVTAMIDGHSHTVEEKVFRKGAASVPILQTGTQLQGLGQLTITFGDSGVTSVQGKVLTAEEVAAYPLTESGKAKAAEVADVINMINAEHKEILGETLCENDAPLWGGYIYYDYAEPRIVETSYGDLVTDAFAEYGHIFAEQIGLDMPVIAAENGGGISYTLPYGAVTRGDVLNAFNHGNNVEALRISPYELFLALESGLVMTGQDDTGFIIREKVSGSFLQVSGLTYTYDPAGEANSKIVSVVLDDGTELSRDDREHSLLLVTNSYVGAWFDEEDKLGDLGGEDIIVERYLMDMTENGTVPLRFPTDGGRIRIANDRSPDTYCVSIPVLDGEDALANRVVNIITDSGDAEEYVTDENGFVNLTLEKGAHTLYLEESADNKPVYVNNYSGSGTVTTADGYYRLAFAASAELPEYVPAETEETEGDTAAPETAESAPATTPGSDSKGNPDTGANAPAVVMLAVISCAAVFAVSSAKKRG